MALRKSVLAVAVLGAWLGLSWGEADAQLLGGGLPSLPVVPTVGGALRDTVNGVTDETGRSLQRVTDAVGRPLSAPRRWDKDPLGAAIVRGEIVSLSPSENGLAAALAMGFQMLRTETISPLDIAVVVLRVPDGLTPADAIAKLRAADRQGQYDFNHIYNPGGSLQEPAPALAPGQARGMRVGMIDGGIDARHSAFRGVDVRASGFVADCRPQASAHGTAVAALLAGAGTTLYAADVFCGHADGGSAEAIARAFGWLADAGVPVVNISLAGPPNALLAAATNAMVKRGTVLVAAVGNDGPAAGVRYPAAYPGVIAVTSVDEQNRIEIDAGQGVAVAFAARGVKVRVAQPGGGFVLATGTSFASPVVARACAGLMDRPDPAAAAAVFTDLQQRAVPIGVPGRNAVFGYGVLPSAQR
jgi:hypothetical protein